jgi:hypothetical protein
LQKLSLIEQYSAQVFSLPGTLVFGPANQKARQLALLLRDVVEVSDLRMLWCMAKRFAFGTYVS